LSFLGRSSVEFRYVAAPMRPMHSRMSNHGRQDQ
jgi:hypothetical protein